MTYRVRRAPRTSTIEIRGIRHRLVRWGPDGSQPDVFLHGWGDTAATFQFLVDAFAAERPIVAIDWRGFGASDWLGTPYWFPDYLADLDALLDQVHPDGPARLVGHSMGGNVASLYAGIRPERVRAVVNLEGIGLKRTRSEEAPERFRRWLGELKGNPRFAEFPSLERFQELLMRKNPRLPADRARFVAESWSRDRPGGGLQVATDPMHRVVNPVLYRREEAEACWRACVAPVLMVLGGVSEFRVELGDDATEAYFRSIFPDVRVVTLDTAGHMMHHEQPEVVASLVEAWLDGLPGS